MNSRTAVRRRGERLAARRLMAPGLPATAAAAAAAAARATRAGLVHAQGAPVEVRAVERGDRRGGRRLVHLDEPETAGTARLAVGELSAVEPELLVYAWEAVVEDGPDAGAKLVIEWHPADQRCATCGEAKDRASGSWMRLCPDCGMPLEVSGGDELDVLDLSFEATEATG